MTIFNSKLKFVYIYHKSGVTFISIRPKGRTDLSVRNIIDKKVSESKQTILTFHFVVLNRERTNLVSNKSFYLNLKLHAKIGINNILSKSLLPKFINIIPKIFFVNFKNFYHYINKFY